MNAHSAVAAAKRSGDLIPQPCRDCGTNQKIEAHHSDYRRPLNVTWLCRPCHRKEHARLRAAEIDIPRDEDGGETFSVRLDLEEQKMLADLMREWRRKKNDAVREAIREAWKARFPEKSLK